MTENKQDELDNLTGFELNVLMLLHCIATKKRGYTHEQRVYLQLLENVFFPEKE